MKRRELASLVLAAFALAAFLVQLSGAIAQLLPGGGAQLEWMLRWLGAGEPPEILLNPALGLVALLTCFTPFALLIGAVAFLLWRSAATDRRRDADRRRQGADWSTTALLHWIDTSLAAACNGEPAWKARLVQARSSIHPHLTEPHRGFFERVLERATSGGASRPPIDAAGEPPRLWPQVAFNVLLVLAVAQVGLAAVMGAALAVLDSYPILGMPLGPAAVFQGVTTFLSFALVSLLIAFAIRRLGRSIAALTAETERDLDHASDRLSAGLVDILKRAPPVAGDEPHRLASLLAAALLEGTVPRLRVVLLARLRAEGFLRAPDALDLRGCRLGAIDLEGVSWPGVVLAGVDLEGARLANAVLEDADLSGSRLRGAFLQGAVLAQALLRGSDLAGASAQRMDLRGADLSGCDLTGALLWGTDLTAAADLSGAALTDARVGSQPLAPPSRDSAAVGVAS